MQRRSLTAGAVALVAALGLAFAASRSGERVEFDTVDDILATKFNAQANETSAAVFDESKISTYELQVDPADWKFLGDFPALEEYRPATLSYRGRAYEGIGIRYKGSVGALKFCFDAAGRLTCDKLSLKLKFDEYDASGQFYGMRRLNLHSMARDPTKMHEALSYGLFREAGVAAPRTAYARVVVNGESLGLYLAVEEIDLDFARHAFPDAGRGTLFKEVWPGQTTIEPYIAAVEAGPKERTDVMLRFAEALNAAEDDDFVQVLGAWVDLDLLARYLAVDRLIDNWDGIVAWYCPPGIACFNHNYYWYVDGFSDRLWLIPWDMDFTFMYPSPIRTTYGMPDWDAAPDCRTIRVFANIPGRPPSCDPLIARLASLLWDPYAAATRGLLAGPFAIERLQARIDRLRLLIADEIAADPNPQTPAQWGTVVAKLREDVVRMQAAIERKLAR